MGNVYSGCGDGVEVWNPEGVPLGVIAIEGGVANFCFGEQGVLYACNETRFWKVQLNKDKVRGALLGL
jgi:gluconolactonase